MTDSSIFRLERRNGINVIYVDGNVDIMNSPELSDKLETAAAQGGAMVLSFVQTAFVDSSCLTALIRAHRTFPSRIHVIAPPGAQVRRTIETTGLNRVLDVYDDLDVALTRVSLPPSQPPST